MKTALLFDGASALGASPDLLILETVEAVERVLSAEGHQVVRVPVNPDARWIERMRRGRFDLAFNLCEGVDGVAALEPAVIGVLELLGVTFTGSSSHATSLCLRKPAVNALLASLGLPVPSWTVVPRGGPRPAVDFPAICKPAAEDASLGVEQRSVVKSRRALGQRLAAMHEQWDDILVQQYIDGREVNVGILGDTVLSIAEIDFGAMPRGMWPIVTYRSKWETGSEEDRGSRPTCPADLPAETAGPIERIALSAWSAVGGHGYGRIDFRIDREGRPWILEINANPDLAPDAGLARMAKAVGMDYGALVGEIVRLASQRAAGDPVDVEERWARTLMLSGARGAESGEAPDLFAVGHR